MIRGSLLVCLVLGAGLATIGMASPKKEPSPPQFKYAAGTESISEGCEGNLEMNPEAMAFRCSGGEIQIPYAAIASMEYRSEVSKRVQKMKVQWKIRPAVDTAILKTKKNRFFTVVYRTGQTPHIVVLRVDPRAMRPYLAELDLRSDKRVEVETFEDD